MSEVHDWIYLDGPEPTMVRELLDMLYDIGPDTPEDEESDERAILAQLDVATAAPSPKGADEAPNRDSQHGDDEKIDEPLRRTAAVLVEEVEPAPDSAPPDAPGPSILAAPSPASVALPVAGPPASLAATALALDLPREVWQQNGNLPFVPADQVPPRKRAAKTEAVPVMKRSGLAETVPEGDDSIRKAALPFVTGAVGAPGASIASFPELGLTAYASLLAELTVRPEESAEILHKYRVPDSASRRALDEHWRQRLATHPEERVAFEEACVVYTDYVRRRRG